MDFSKFKQKIDFPYIKKGKDDFEHIPNLPPEGYSGEIYERRIDAGEDYYVPIEKITYVNGVGYFERY